MPSSTKIRHDTSIISYGSTPISTAWIDNIRKSAIDTLKGERKEYADAIARHVSARSSFESGIETPMIPDDLITGCSSSPSPLKISPFDAEWLLTVQSRSRSAGRRTGASLGIGLASIALLPLGPIIMLIGAACGLVVGFILGSMFDWINTKRSISLADKELKRLTYLVRFAIDEINRRLFSQSDAHGNAYCCDLLESVILEFKPYVEVGHLSNSALKKLNLFYSFLHHRNVYHCLWIYVNDFLAKWATNLTVIEFAKICRDILTTLVDLEKTLNVSNSLEVIGKVNEFLNDPKIKQLNVAHWKPNDVAIKNLEAVLIREYYMRADPLSSPVPSTGHRSGRAPRKSSMDELFARRNSDLLREPTEVVFPPTDEDYFDIEEDCAIFSSPPAAVVSSCSGSPRALKINRPSSSLFKSFTDFINFDVLLKHKIPISNSEFRFLYEKETESTSGWELAAEKKFIKIFKFVPPVDEVSKGTSVLIRAYATLPSISIESVFYNIFDPIQRQSWDTNFAQIEVLPKIDQDDCEVLYCVLQSPFGVTPRDFLQFRKATQIDRSQEPGLPSQRCLTILMRSAEHEQKPLLPGFIRAESYISGYVIRENDEGGCNLFIMSQTDVKGLIPKWIVNMMASKAPAQWVNNLMKACNNLDKSGEFLHNYVKLQVSDTVLV